LNSEPLLPATPSGDVLELRAAGSWIAANVAKLEALSQSVNTDIDQSKIVRLDMTGVSELDTLGAWLLEKLSRQVTGSPAQIVGVPNNFGGLMEEVPRLTGTIRRRCLRLTRRCSG
jgi:phospholipid/cholesterol/gamma-HCH transport system permease protein